MIYKPDQREYQMIINWLYNKRLWHTKTQASREKLVKMYFYLTGNTVSRSKITAYFWEYIKSNSSFKGCGIGDKKKKKQPVVNGNFYQSKPWRMLRVKALVKYGRKCCLCGRGVNDGVILHVDHIKPRSKFPELELRLSNLQILCEDCNLGKSNHYSKRWRD